MTICYVESDTSVNKIQKEEHSAEQIPPAGQGYLNMVVSITIWILNSGYKRDHFHPFRQLSTPKNFIKTSQLLWLSYWLTAEQKQTNQQYLTTSLENNEDTTHLHQSQIFYTTNCTYVQLAMHQLLQQLKVFAFLTLQTNDSNMHTTGNHYWHYNQLLTL